MKLVQLLAKKLKEWPEGAKYACQDTAGAYEGSVFFVSNEPEHIDGSGGWSVCGVIDAIYNLEVSSDAKIKTVTKSQWQSERDRQSGGEWKRHRAGRNQPVNAGVRVEVKLRCGDIQQGNAHEFIWLHSECDVAANIMQYRIISQPQADEVEVNAFVGKDVKIEYAYAQEGVEPEHLEWKTMGTAKIDNIFDLGPMEAKTDQIETPFKWRDEVTELNAYIEKYTRERDAIIERLASEGFALIPAMTAVMVVADVDMGDWRNWEIGDHLEIFDEKEGHEFKMGQIVKVTGFDGGDEDLPVKASSLNDDEWWFVNNLEAKFIRRP